MSVISVADLVTALCQLLPAPQQQEVERLQTSFADPRALGDELVKRGWLTPYQVERLFQGKADELVLGPYVLLERLGEGGMGAVFKARHGVMNRRVAVKLLRPEYLDSPQAVQRFRREIQVAAQLAHPHVVLAHDAGQVGDRHYLVMELIEGVDLARLVQRGGPLPVGQACEYIRQAAAGMQYAHEQGMVHRDIKPSNLMVDGRGTVKVLDLGLARPRATGPEGSLVEDMTRTGAVMGTPDYLAPEQALDARRADIRADLYSLGGTLYYLLAGHPPFPEGGLAQKLLLHQNAEPPGIEGVRPDVPQGVAAVLRRLLAKRPEDRYQTPADVVAALTPFCQVGASAPAWPARAATVTLPTAGVGPSLIDGAVATPERGWTLPVSSSSVSLPAPARPPRRLLVWAALAVGVACLILLVLILVGGGGGRPLSPGLPGAGGAPAGSNPGRASKPGPAPLTPIPEGPLVLDLVTKLGATRRVTPVRVGDGGHFGYALGIPAPGDHRLEMRLAPGVELVVPMGLVRKLVARGGEQVVILADGTEHAGTALSGLVAHDGENYLLREMAQVTVVSAGRVSPRAGKELWTLTLAEPAKRRFTVLAPRFASTDRGTATETFHVRVGGEVLRADWSGFERVALRKGPGLNWQVTVKAPAGESRTGALQVALGGPQILLCDLPSGAVLGLFLTEDVPAVTLEKADSPQ
ncbi:MAG: protein kinase [Gemmataceae bacterium]|nr:protein kinase [Gemmataceae bacterium]